MLRWPCLLLLAATGVTVLIGDDLPPLPDRPERPRSEASTSDGETPEAGNAGPLVRRVNVRSPLEGKVVAITLKSDPDYGVYLEKVQVQMLGRDAFLVGTGVETGIEDWSVGRRTWIAVDDISQMTEFASVQEVRELLKANASPYLDPDA